MCRYLPEKPLVSTAVVVVTMGNELFSQHLAKVTSAEAGAPSPLHELLLSDSTSQSSLNVLQLRAWHPPRPCIS